MLAKVPLGSMLVPVKLLLELFSCEKVVLDSGACPLYYLPRHAINFYMLPYLLLLTALAFTVSMTHSFATINLMVLMRGLGGILATC